MRLTTAIKCQLSLMTLIVIEMGGDIRNEILNNKKGRLLIYFYIVDSKSMSVFDVPKLLFFIVICLHSDVTSGYYIYLLLHPVTRPDFGDDSFTIGPYHSSGLNIQRNTSLQVLCV